MAIWPSAVSTDADLYVAKNALQTTLATALGTGDVSVVLTSSTGFPVAGAVVIGNEVIFYTNISGATLTGCTRGADGTTAAAHSVGVPVGAAIVAFHHNGLKDEVIAIESFLNTHLGKSTAVVAAEFERLVGVTSSIQTQITARALDSAVVHNTGVEAIAGAKTFSSALSVISAAAADLRNIIQVNNATGDPFINFATDTTNWSIGSDNSVNDQFVVAKSAALGTTNYLTINAAGEMGAGPEAVSVATCAFNVEQTVSGSDMIVRMGNNASNAASGAQMLIFVNDNASGDPYLRFAIGSSTNWVFGTDNSDSNRLKMSQNSSLGTNDVFVVDPTTFGVSIRGTNTTDNAAAGFVGEAMSTGSGSASNFPATTTYGDAASLSLTAGDWDVTFLLEYDNNGATWTRADIGISANSGNNSTGLTLGNNFVVGVWPSSSATVQGAFVIPVFRVSLSATTTYYAKVRATFSAGTPQYYYRFSARRVR